MNNLKVYAGLLNEEAPKDHFLAYITPSERDMLVEAGGVKTPTESGIFAYPPDGQYGGGGYSGGGADANDGFGGGNNNNNNNNNQGSDSGHSRFDVGSGYYGEPTTTTTTTNNNNNNNDNFDYETQAYNITNPFFDYETDAYSGDTNIDAGFGLGKITNATYNKDTGLVEIEQTPGIINTEQYQTANLKGYLDSPDVSDKDKINTLNQLQALTNSDLKGSKLSNIETDFVLDNLDASFNNIKEQTKYSKYTSSIDETATTFAKDISDDMLGTVAKSGGIIGTIFRGSTDFFKNNKALETLGYTGKTIKYNPDGSGDFNYGGGFLTGNPREGEREAVNQLTPLAANIIGGTPQQASMVNNYFSNLNNTNLGISQDYLNTYNTAKTKMANTLNMTPPNQQFGYGNNYNDTYARQMNNTNIFYNYLNEQGLI